MTLLKPNGDPWPAEDMTPNGTPFLNNDDPLHWLDDWTHALALTLDEAFRPHDDVDGLITPASIGAAPASHTHTPASIGAAPASHTHTPASIGAAPASHTHPVTAINETAGVQTYAPVWNVGNGTTSGRYVRIGPLIVGSFVLTLGSDRGPSATSWIVSLPSGPVGHWSLGNGTGSMGGSAPIILGGIGGGNVGLYDAAAGHRIAAGSPPTGITFATGQTISATFTYMAA